MVGMRRLTAVALPTLRDKRALRAPGFPLLAFSASNVYLHAVDGRFDMRKRSVDLSLDELAAMGANAALTAAQKAYDAGLTVAGTVDLRDGDRLILMLAERRPSGAVSVISPDMSAEEAEIDITLANAPGFGKPAS
jgi:hypothetical protein